MRRGDKRLILTKVVDEASHLAIIVENPVSS